MIQAHSNHEDVAPIRDWHAHAYFDSQSIEQARALCIAARDLFPVQMGRVHERPVGPHPQWSCQLSFLPADFAQVVVWLNMKRDGLTFFVHPNTGQALEDHRDRAIWLGHSAVLDLSVLT